MSKKRKRIPKPPPRAPPPFGDGIVTLLGKVKVSESIGPKTHNIQNNIITEGRNNGAMLLRWVDAQNCPIPDIQIKSIKGLEIKDA